jgi:hypothetical protein
MTGGQSPDDLRGCGLAYLLLTQAGMFDIIVALNILKTE